MEMMTAAMIQTRYFATALAKNSAVTMAADVFPSSTYSRELCLTGTVNFEVRYLQPLVG